MTNKFKSAKSFKPKRKCFGCGKGIASTISGTGFNLPPANATFWTTPGNYGSRVFDPMDSNYLEIYICDPCLVKNSDRAYEVEGNKVRKFEPS